LREFHQNKGRTKTVIWRIWRDEDRVFTTHGQYKGKMVEDLPTVCKGVNLGKANEKSPEVVAQELLERRALKKEREGYEEVEPYSVPIEDEGEEQQFCLIDPARSTRFWKPQRSLNAGLTALIKKGDAWFLRKRDGVMFVVTVDDCKFVRMFSSTMDPCHKDEPGVPWTERFPHIVISLKKAGATLPPLTVLLGEVCLHGPENVDGYQQDSRVRVANVMKSLTPRALEVQEVEDGKYRLGFCIWDVAAYNGEFIITTETYRHRIQHAEFIARDCGPYVTHPERIRCDERYTYMYRPNKNTSLAPPGTPTPWTQETAQQYAKNVGWEGFVVVDPDAVFGDRGVSFHGKSERPATAAKLKTIREGDFIARFDPDNGVGKWGKGNRAGLIGNVALFLWDPEKEEEVFISNCGGWKGVDLLEYVRALSDPKLYPMVWEVEFSGWTEHGSLDFPQHLRVRENKTLNECDIGQRPEMETA